MRRRLGGALGVLWLLVGCGSEPTRPGIVHHFASELDAEHPWQEDRHRVMREYRNAITTVAGRADEWRSSPRRVPRGASLEFGMGRAGEPPGYPLRFSVFAERSGERIELFTRDLVGPPAWQDARVDLAELAGDELRFVFRSEPLRGRVPRDALALWGDPVLIGPVSDPGPEAPNLVLISLDTLRADHLGAYGYTHDTSPNLDRFMEESLVFDRCYAPSSWTTPSHATVFTGHHPVVHGAGGIQGKRLDGRFTTLAEVARRAGYLTAAFTEGVAVSGQIGFQQGFRSYHNGRPVPRPPGTAEKTFGRAEEWLDRYGRLPFLLFVHTYEVHTPYHAPKAFEGRFEPEGSEPMRALGGPLLRSELSDAQKLGVVATYDASIAYTDSVVGGLLDKLRDEGFLHNTIVVIFSDHGEEFWDHGATEHGLSLYDEVLHVPLAIRLPGDDPPRGRIDQLVGLGDLFATLVELLSFDVAVPANSRSLRALWDTGAAGEPYERSLVTSQLVQTGVHWLMLSARSDAHKYVTTTVYQHPESPVHRFRGTLDRLPPAEAERALMRHLLAGGRALGSAESEEERQRMLRSAREELFDLRGDPAESRDLVLSELETVDRYRRALDGELERLARDAEAVGARSEPMEPLGEEERAELRALGYVE